MRALGCCRTQETVSLHLHPDLGLSVHPDIVAHCVLHIENSLLSTVLKQFSMIEGF